MSKFPMLLLFAAICPAQTPKPKPAPKPPPTADGSDWTTTGASVVGLAPSYPPAATWMEAMKDGAYTATFTDPNNKWRCYVTSTTHTNVLNPAYDSVNAFTVVCVDTSKPSVPYPAKTEGAKP